MKYTFTSLLFLALFMLFGCGDYGRDSQSNEGSDQKNKTKEHIQSAEITKEQKKELLNRGDSIAQVAFQTLSGELKNAMQRGGVKEAVKYCRVNAYPLTDSVGEQFGTELMRVAEKYRNPQNALTDFDTEHFAAMKQGKQKMLVLHGGNAVFYKRIDLAPQCLSCHGVPGKDIADTDYDFIKEKYPKDQAVNFKPGDLRGMWKITFPLSY